MTCIEEWDMRTSHESLVTSRGTCCCRAGTRGEPESLVSSHGWSFGDHKVPMRWSEDAHEVVIRCPRGTQVLVTIAWEGSWESHKKLLRVSQLNPNN